MTGSADMIKTLKGKIMLVILFALIIFNLGLSIFIYNSFYNDVKSSIKSDMENMRKFSTNTLKYSAFVTDDTDKIRSKSISEVNSNYGCYVGLYDDSNKAIDSKGKELDSNIILNILKESDKKSSIIKFKNNGTIMATYVYPVYLNGEYDSSLIIQNRYDDLFNKISLIMRNIIIAQFLLLIVIIFVLNYFINRIISPLKKLSLEMKKYGQGREVDKVLVNTYDEVSEAADSFNKMIEDKKKLENISKNFFNNATHELKTPITSIYGYLQILNENDDVDENFKKRAVSRMIMESVKLKELVSKLLEISRSGIIKRQQRQKFMFDELIIKLCERLTDRAEKIEKKFQIDTDKVCIYAVREDIEHIVLNVLDNALKYSKGSSIKISLQKNGLEGFVLKITNAIYPIPKEISKNLTNAFVKYNNFDQDMEKNISSSGLGLYLCSELASKNDLNFDYKIDQDIIEFCIFR